MRVGIVRDFRRARVLALAVGLLFPASALRASQTLGALSLLSVSPRIITPNGDNRNDVAFFNFDQHLSGFPISGEVFDVTGAKVGNLSIFSGDDTKMTWNGRDEDGNLLGSGIYIYQITLGDSRVTGAVVIAR